MDLLTSDKPINLYDRQWIIYTRSEERAPMWVEHGAVVEDSLISTGCIIRKGAKVIRSVLSPGVIVESGAVIEESIVLTDTVIEANACVRRAILDKQVRIGANAKIGSNTGYELQLTMIGKNSTVPDDTVVRPGGMVGTDVTNTDYCGPTVETGAYIHTQRLPNEI